MNKFGGLRWFPSTPEGKWVLLGIFITFLFNIILTAVSPAFGYSPQLVFGIYPPYMFWGAISMLLCWICVLIGYLTHNAQNKKNGGASAD